MLTAETIDRLKQQLQVSGLSQRNQPLFQVISLLIDAARQSFTNIEQITGGGGGGGGGVLGATILTAGVETATLPNSLQVLPGQNIQFQDTPNRRVIHAIVPHVVDGIDGIDGEVGPPGIQGPTGATGATGSAGPAGMPGIDGEDGEDGLPGIQGPQGFTGATGAIGPPGIPGIDGLDGEDGSDGMPGPIGPTGVTGATGSIGPQGPPGLDGIDGETGPIGPSGPQGIQGLQGIPGLDGDDGEQGPLGPQGPQGVAGATGSQGIQGVPGPPGMDAEEPEEPMMIPGPAGASSGGSANVKQTEVDFGATPSIQQTFTVIDADVTSSSQLIGTVAYEAPTGKDLDEMEMDDIDIKFAPGSGQFDVIVTGMEGYLADKFKINYLIG